MSDFNSRYSSRRASLRSNVYGYSAMPFASDYERQQVETHSGRLVAGRYYLRARSGEGSRSSGPGFALGSMPYNRGSHSPRSVMLSHASSPLAEASAQSIPSASSPLTEACTQNITSAASVKGDVLEPKSHIFEPVYLFLCLLLQYLMIGINDLYVRLFAVCTSGLSPFTSIHSVLCAMGSYLLAASRSTVRTIKPRALYIFVSLLLVVPALKILPQVKNAFHNTAFDLKTFIPSSSLKIESATANHWSPPQLFDFDDLSASHARLVEIKDRFMTHSLDAELVMAEMDAYEGQFDGFLKHALKKVFTTYPKLRRLGGSKAWIDARDIAHQKAKDLLKQNPVLSFLQADPQTGSFSFREWEDTKFEINDGTKALLTLVGHAIYQDYEDRLSAIWQSDQEKDWQGFIKALKAFIYPAIDDVMTKIMDDGIAHDKRPEFIMFMHSQLMTQSSKLANLPVLAKILGDYFALLATDSLITLLKSFKPQAYFSIDHKVLPPLYTTLSYFVKPYHARQINFASEKIGTYIVRPDTPSFTPPLSKTTKLTRRKMDASHALRDGMAPGECWAFDSNGGKLSFRMPLTISPKKLVIYHPLNSQEVPPSFVQLYAHAPNPGQSPKEGWRMVAQGFLEWQTSEAYRFATLDAAHVDYLASHYRLMAYLTDKDESEASFGCVYQIELQGHLPAANNADVGYF